MWGESKAQTEAEYEATLIVVFHVQNPEIRSHINTTNNANNWNSFYDLATTAKRKRDRFIASIVIAV